MDPLHQDAMGNEPPYDMGSLIQGDSQSSLMFPSMMGTIGSPFIYRSNTMDFSDDDLFSSSLPTGQTASPVIDGNSFKARRRKASQPQRLVYCEDNVKNGQHVSISDAQQVQSAHESPELQSLEVRRDLENLVEEIREEKSTEFDTKPNIAKTSDLKKYPCPNCQEYFPNRKSLKSHVKSHDNQASHEKRKQKCNCNICGVSLFNKTALKNHIKRIHEKPVREFKCQTCHKEFISKAELTQHTFVHSQDKNFSCDVCGKKFASKPYLERHVKTHTGDKPTFTCEVCNKQLSDKTGFVAHMRAHSGERPYECSVCGNKYTIKRHLTSHARIHSETRPFACEVEGCGKTFRSRSNLRMHRDFHAGVKRWSCSYCSRSFLSQGNMAKHVRRHLGEKKYTCDYCPKAFIEKQELKSHMKVHSSSSKLQNASLKKNNNHTESTTREMEGQVQQETDATSPSSRERPLTADRSNSFQSNVEEEMQVTEVMESPNRDNSPCEVTSTLETIFGSRHPSSSSESVGHLDDMVVITLIDGNDGVSSHTRQTVDEVSLLNPQSHTIGSSSSHELTFQEGNYVSSSNHTSFPQDSDRLPSMGYTYHMSEQVFNCTLCSLYYPEAFALRHHLVEYHRVDPDKIH
jgi:uncharacterized Zn-finger protein